MQDEHQHMTELGPMWRRVDKIPPPKACKLLFRSLYGGVVVGVWHDESGWAFWSPLPKHTEEDKAWIRAQSRSPAGQFINGENYEVGYEY